MKCKHSTKAYFAVRFRNGSRHIAEHCADCDKYIKYAPRDEEFLKTLPERENKTKLRIEAGLPVGCFGCGNKASQHGFCGACNKKEIKKFFKSYCKKAKKTIWQLNKEEVEAGYNEFWQQTKTPMDDEMERILRMN